VKGENPSRENGAGSAKSNGHISERTVAVVGMVVGVWMLL